MDYLNIVPNTGDSGNTVAIVVSVVVLVIVAYIVIKIINKRNKID